MYSLSQLSEILGTTFSGDPDTLIRDVKPLDSAGPEDLTLAASPSFIRRIEQSAAAAVIVPQGVEAGSKPLLFSMHPKLTFARALELLSRRPFQSRGVSDQAAIGRDCTIAQAVTIEPFVRIGDGVVIEGEVTVESGARIGSGSHIGRGSTIHANVTLYRRTVIGCRTTVHSGTVIGADGFGYVWDGNRQVKLQQRGYVQIGDDVEIGANCCIDRATSGATVIEDDVKLDNLVHIGHNCRIGQSTIIVGCVGISGSVQVGRQCIIAGQTGFVDHVKIGDNVTIMGDTVVTRDVPPDATISGRFGRPHAEELQIEAVKRKLPELYREVRRIRNELKTLVSGRGAETDE